MEDNGIYNIKDVIDYQIWKVLGYTNLSYAELYQIGYLGYLKAQENYNAEYGQMTLLYACRYIRHELMAEIKKTYKYDKLKSNPKTNEEYLDFIENRPDDMPVNFTHQPFMKKLKALVARLPEKEADIIYETYLAKKPKKLKDLSDKYGVSQQRIHQIKSSAIEKLREWIK